MQLVPTDLPGVTIVEPRVFGDGRGYFLETYSQERYREAGIGATFVQDNLSFSARGVLRGLHFQNPHPQAKLVTVLQGEVYDVAVDIRVGSPTFAKFVGVVLSGENKRQLYIAEGFAHGFCVTSETPLFIHKSSHRYSPHSHEPILFTHPSISIPSPIAAP